MTRSPDMKGFSFDMPLNHYELLTYYAEQHDLKASQILRQLVRSFVEENCLLKINAD